MVPRRSRRRNARYVDLFAGRPFIALIGAALAAAGVAACQSAVSSVTTGASAPKCQLTMTAAGVPAQGGAGSISITTNPECEWTATTQVPWISQLAPAAGQGSGTVGFQAAANPLSTPREGDVAINDERVRIAQEGAPCRFTLDPDSQEFGAGGGTGRANVTGPEGCSWSATSDDPWIVITSVTTERGGGSVAFAVAANSGGGRRGSMTIAERTFTVTQSGLGGSSPPAPGQPAPPPPPPLPPCTFSIDRTSFTLVPSAGRGGLSISVTTPSHCGWTARSNVGWMSVTSGASGTGNGSVTFAVATNSGPGRSGTLTIAGRDVTVTQVPAPAFCGYNIDPTSANLPAGGGTGSIRVSAAPGCPWVATTDRPWIVITSGGGGGTTGGGSASFQTGPNSGPARSGTIEIAGLTFAVTQEGD